MANFGQSAKQGPFAHLSKLAILMAELQKAEKNMKY